MSRSVSHRLSALEKVRCKKSAILVMFKNPDGVYYFGGVMVTEAELDKFKEGKSGFVIEDSVKELAM